MFTPCVLTVMDTFSLALKRLSYFGGDLNTIIIYFFLLNPTVSQKAVKLQHYHNLFVCLFVCVCVCGCHVCVMCMCTSSNRNAVQDKMESYYNKHL